MLPFLAALAPFAPIIGGAIGAVGSLLAPKPKAQKQTTVTNNSIDLMKLRTDAEAAGFNPITIIRGGGLAGYGSSTTTGTISAAPETRLSDAFRTFGSGVAAWQYDPYGEAKSLSQLRLAEAQIADLGRRGAEPNMSLHAPSSQGPNSTAGGGDFTLWGVEWDGNPNTTNAEDGETRYGEIGELVFGIGAGVADLFKASHDWGRENIGPWLFGMENAAKSRVEQFDADWAERRAGFNLTGSGL
nr:MAG: hypothetical protein [Microvirus sp.]